MARLLNQSNRSSLKSNQLIFIGLRSSYDYYKRPGGVVCVCGQVWWGVSFFNVDRCVLSEWVVGGGVLNGFFGEQGLPVGIHQCIEGFH